MNIKNLLIALCLTLGTAVGANAQCAMGQQIDYAVVLYDGTATSTLDQGWFEVSNNVELPSLLDGFVLDFSDDMVVITVDNNTTTTLPVTIPAGQRAEIRFAGPGVNQTDVSVAALDPSSTVAATTEIRDNGFRISLPEGTVISDDFLVKINLTFDSCTPLSAIPTMGQWALLILGLSITSIALVTIRKAQMA